MTMLSDDEIYAMYNEPRSDAEMLEFARELITAHTAKLLANVEMPRPDRNAWPNGFHDLYTEYQLQQYAAAAAPVQPECDAARVLEWMRTPNRKPAQLAFTEGLERQAAYWVEIAQGEPLRAQPLTCDTCKFSEADKDNPAIRIYEETCFWCSQYYANHYEAHGIGVQK